MANKLTYNTSEVQRLLDIVDALGTVIIPSVKNGDSITPTGTYATSVYYNLAYGVKIGYMANGDIILSMQGGTTTAYEYLYFTLASAPDGVTLNAATTFVTTAYATSSPAVMYACILSGIKNKVNISIALTAVNATYDYTTVEITVTEV